LGGGKEGQGEREQIGEVCAGRDATVVVKTPSDTSCEVTRLLEDGEGRKERGEGGGDTVEEGGEGLAKGRAKVLHRSLLYSMVVTAASDLSAGVKESVRKSSKERGSGR